MSGAGAGGYRWSEVVTAALLGTSRRPLPHPAEVAGAGPDKGAPETVGSGDPAERVLQLAARHRVAALVGTPPRRRPAPAGTDADWLVLAPKAAQQVLVSLLAQPEPVLVNVWLAECADRGLGVGSDLWPRLAVLAARQTAYDRRLIRRVLGERGQWFLRQHPQWSRLAAEPAVDPADHSDPDVDSHSTPAREAVFSGVPAVLAAVAGAESASKALEMVLASGDPWPPELARAALQLVLGGGLGANTREAATAVALRLPLALAPQLSAARADRAPGAGPPLSLVRGAEQILARVDRILTARVEIHASFAEHQPVPGPTPEPSRTHP